MTIEPPEQPPSSPDDPRAVPVRTETVLPPQPPERQMPAPAYGPPPRFIEPDSLLRRLRRWLGFGR